jgi:hypothetical protein
VLYLHCKYVWNSIVIIYYLEYLVWLYALLSYSFIFIHLLACVVPMDMDISWVTIWPQVMVMRVHTGSGIGTSGNMTILMRREPGSGSPLTDVGGAWMPSRLIYIIIRHVQKWFNYRINDFKNLIKASITDRREYLHHYSLVCIYAWTYRQSTWVARVWHIWSWEYPSWCT